MIKKLIKCLLVTLLIIMLTPCKVGCDILTYLYIKDRIETFQYVQSLENPDEYFKCDFCGREGKLRDFPKHDTDTCWGTICGYCID